MAYITLEQILSLPQLKDAQVLGGVSKDVQYVKWGHMIELPDIEQWIDYGELIMMTGVGLRNVEEDLQNIVQAIHRKNAAGLLIEIGPYISEIPKSVIDLSNELSVPLIKAPFSMRINEIMTMIYMMYYKVLLGNESDEAVLRKLLYYDYDESVLETAVSFGYDTELKYRSLVVESDQISKDYNNSELGYTLMNFFLRNIPVKKKHFLLADGNCFIVMLPMSHDMNKKELICMLKKLQAKIASLYKGASISIGVGEAFYKLRDFKRSTMEAKKSMKLLRSCKRSNCIRFYEDIGIYRLFFNMDEREELRRMLKSYLGQLITYDEENGTSLVHTLEVYLAHDRNIGISAEELFIHRNTMKYRIKKAQQILNVDFEDSNTCFNIRLAFKIKRFLYDIGVQE